MKIKLEKLVNCFNDLREIGNTKLKSPLNFKLMTVLNEVQKFFNDFEKVRHTKIKEYGYEDDNGNYSVKPENIDAFNQEITALCAHEVELPDVDIKLSEFGDAEIKPVTLMSLSWLIKE